MNVSKLAKIQKARELARWFREEVRCGRAGSTQELMASAAISLEREAFRLEREGGRRATMRRPRLVDTHAA